MHAHTLTYTYIGWKGRWEGKEGGKETDRDYENIDLINKCLCFLPRGSCITDSASVCQCLCDLVRHSTAVRTVKNTVFPVLCYSVMKKIIWEL